MQAKGTNQFLPGIDVNSLTRLAPAYRVRKPNLSTKDDKFDVAFFIV